jgi:hypothetical protein
VTPKDWAELAISVYAGMIEDRHHFAQASYRDGQWYFMLDKPGTNINGESYAPELGAALRKTLLEPVGQWCVFWWPHPTIGNGIRREALAWLARHKPPVRWIPDRPVGKAMHYGLAAPFFRACRTRRVVLVGPGHLAGLDLFPVERHIVCPDGTAWREVDRLAAEVMSAHQPDDLVLFAAGHASNLLIHRLWPDLKGRATLFDIGASLDPFVGIYSRGEFREPDWVANVLPLNHPDGRKPPAPVPPAKPQPLAHRVRPVRRPPPPPPPRRRAVPRPRPKPAPAQPRAAAVRLAAQPLPPPPPLPEVANPKWALILGGGQSVWDDVRALEETLGRPWDGVVIAANDVGCHWGRDLHHWVTLHPEKMSKWVQERVGHGHPGGYITWTRRGGRGADRQLDSWAGGSSGLLAVSVAAHIGCTRIVLCGVPMNREPHFAESKVHARNKPWSSADGHWKAWQAPHVLTRLRAMVRSMSGRTRDLLGAPTLDWLVGEQQKAA